MHNNPPDSTAEDVRAVATLADGGALASMDIKPAGPPQFGSWRSTGEDHFAATFWNGGNDPQNGASTVKVVVDGTQDSEDKISGSFTVFVFDASDNQVAEIPNGTFHGTRVVAGA